MSRHEPFGTPEKTEALLAAAGFQVADLTASRPQRELRLSRKRAGAWRNCHAMRSFPATHSFTQWRTSESLAKLRGHIVLSATSMHRGKGDESMVEREGTRTGWDKIAPGYDKTNTVTQMWVGNEGLRRAELRTGMKFLDVASGSGALSIPAARLGAKVTAVDQSPVMLELLQARAKKEGLNVESRVMDGQDLDLEDNTFDMAGSQFGVMVFEDMPLGIREMVRVTKPGGRVLMIVYGDPHKIEFFGYFVGAVQAVRPDFTGPPMDPLPLPFQLKDPERLRRELADAGLKDVKIEQITEPTEYATGSDLWEWIMWSNPIADHVLDELQITAAERDVVRKTMENMHREKTGGRGPLTLTAPINIGIGTK